MSNAVERRKCGLRSSVLAYTSKEASHDGVECGDGICHSYENTYLPLLISRHSCLQHVAVACEIKLVLNILRTKASGWGQRNPIWKLKHPLCHVDALEVTTVTSIAFKARLWCHYAQATPHLIGLVRKKHFSCIKHNRYSFSRMGIQSFEHRIVLAVSPQSKQWSGRSRCFCLSINGCSCVHMADLVRLCQ